MEDKIKPRILFLITRADAVGGASIHTRDVASALRRKYWRVVVGVGGRGPVTDGFKKQGTPFVSLRWFRRKISPLDDLLAIVEVIGLIYRFKPDMVSAHTSKAGAIARLAAWICGVPVIYTPHCWSFVDGFPLAKVYLGIERMAALFTTRIVAVSEDERLQGIERGVGESGLITTLHNGMPDVPMEFRSKPEIQPPRLLMTGRFEIQKDQSTLLKALSKIKQVPWKLDFVGDGPLLNDIKKMAEELGIAERVHFLGYRNDVQSLLSSSQVFLLITHWEGFPRSILEAMRAGLPVIATDVGGSREAVENRVTGYIVPHEDEQWLSERLREVIADPRFRKTMGYNSRKSYEARFTFDIMLKKYQLLYRSIWLSNGSDFVI